LSCVDGPDMSRENLTENKQSRCCGHVSGLFVLPEQTDA